MHRAKFERIGDCAVGVDFGLQLMRLWGAWQGITSEDDEEEKEGKESPDAIGDAKITLVEPGDLLARDVGRNGRRDVGKSPARSSLHAVRKEQCLHSHR